MHILIIPSEEFIPAHNHAIGIFQYHQASVLQGAGHKVGALSITQAFSIPMLLKSLLFKIIGQKTSNATDDFSTSGLFYLGYNKLFRIKEFLKEDTINNIPVYKIEGFYYMPPSDVGNIYGWVKAGIAAYDAYVKTHGHPDVVHAHNAMYAGILAQEIKKKYQIPYIITEHSTQFARGVIKGKKLNSLILQAYQKSNGVFAVSQSFCKLLANIFKDVSFSYLPNVLDPYFEEQKFKNLVDKETFVFLNIAELHPKKNHKLLIEAFAIVKDSIKSTKVKLLLAGAGVELEHIKNQIANYKLDEDVELLGLLNRESVLQRIKESNCIVLSSDVETFGVVLIEGMLLGKPVISTKCGGPESFITDDCGLLVEKQNKKELATAMQQIITNYSNYNAALISQYTLNEFGKDRFLQRVEAAYVAAKNKNDK